MFNLILSLENVLIVFISLILFLIISFVKPAFKVFSGFAILLIGLIVAISEWSYLLGFIILIFGVLLMITDK